MHAQTLNQSNTGVSGLAMTCIETGVTLTSGCHGDVTFYLPTGGGVTYHFSTPGGPGNRCTYPYAGYNYSRATASGHSGTGVNLHVTECCAM